MTISTWSFPTKIAFGAGAAATVAAECERLGLSRVLLVTDRGVVAAGLAAPVENSLKRAAVKVAVFDGISSNPTEAEIEAGAEAFRSADAEGLVALGGGSPLDAAKLVAVRARTDRSWEELDDAAGGGQFVPAVLPPVIALPTTSGTGSEVGRAAVLTVASSGRKTVVFHPSMLPRVAILDPELTKTMPASVTAATGFDALTHCAEAYMARGDHPMADAIAVAGVDLVAKHLPRALEEPADLDARGGMMKAAMMGAVAFQKGLGACHSLAHPLSSEHGLHHGLANALCLPAVIEFNEAEVLERVLHLSLLLGGDAEPGAAAARLRGLRQQWGLPGSLRAAGVADPDLDRLTALAMEDACHRDNPRPVSAQDMRALYQACI
ncbi:MAG: iron-containing alcohol dehydrogenase [Polyangiaceae bacterium]